MTKRIIKLLFITIILSSVVMFVACNKSNKKPTSKLQPSNEKLQKDKDLVLMDGMTVAAINLHDTANNIQGMVVFPRINQKEFSYINIQPINKYLEVTLHEFVNKVKENNKSGKNVMDKNLFNLKVKYVQDYKDIISCVFEKTTHFSNTMDTTTIIQSINYNQNTSKILTFYDVFKLNNNNIKDFQKVFGKELQKFTKEDMKNLDFNIEKDTISLNIVSKINNKQIRLRQPLSKVASFIGNGN